jgi:hypothetical protein
MVDSELCLQILDKGGSKWKWASTVAYYNTATITAERLFFCTNHALLVS